MVRLDFTPGRYAAIDIGTVTCRMLVADVVADDAGPSEAGMRIVPVAKEYSIVNLGEGVDVSRRLSEEALSRTTVAIDTYLDVLASLDTTEDPVISTMVIATSASRDAENSDEFVALLESRGLKLAVIPGETEAALSFMGASAAYAGEDVMVVDIGGGSTEISIGTAGSASECSHSFDIGCRRVTERFWDGYAPTNDAIEHARKWIRPQFAEWLSGMSDANNRKLRMIAVAGTATSVVTMRDEIEPYDPDLVNGAYVSASDLKLLIDRLSRLTLPEIEATVGLDPKRAPVIVAGLVILDEIIAVSGLAGFTASESDILEGMIMYNSMHVVG